MTRILIWMLCLAWVNRGLFGAEPARPANEYEIKTAFVYNIAKLVEWPSGTWSSTNAPVRFGFIGAEPTAPFIKQAFANRYVQDRPVEAVQIKRVMDAASCHVVFVGREETRRLPEIFDAVKDRPVLVIGDEAEAGTKGVAIHFVTVEERVRFVVHMKEAQKRGFVVSSKLIRLALPEDKPTKEGDK